MTPTVTNWIYSSFDNYDKILDLHKQTHIPLPIIEILLKRGINTLDEINRFMTPTIEKLHPPHKLPDIQKASSRIKKAIDTHEKILIYGDFDADGVIATAILYSGLKKSNAIVDWYIPDRFKDGYGLNKEAIDFAQTNDITLIITVDTGITANDEIVYANTKGIDVIITDHHTPSETLPPAIAIINPKLKNSSYPFNDLCGSSVALKLLQYLEEEYHYYIETLSYMDLIAIATIADIMPLIDENRVFVKYGLEQLNEHNRPGLEELIRVSGIKTAINESKIAYSIAPRLNAAGRMGSAHTALELLITDSLSEARGLARTLENKNKERQRINQKIYREAVNIIETSNIKNDPVIVVYSQEWHEGVIGIVASKLVNKYNKPAIVIALNTDGKGKGSARSTMGYDIFKSIEKIKDILLAFGGHTMAAGFSIEEENIDKLKTQLIKDAENYTFIDSQTKQVEIDAFISEEDINWHTYRLLEQMKPFGFGNKKPLLAWRKAPIKGYPRIYKDKHLSFNIGKSGINAIGFNMAHFEQIVMESIGNGSSFVDIAFYIDKNEMYNNNNKVQLKLVDIKPSNG